MSMVLKIKDLCLSINGKKILKSLCLEIASGKTLGLVGESGSGKSMTALSLMRLLPEGSSLSGQILFAGDDITQCDESKMCTLRGRDIAMVFQEPMTALNPVQTIGAQVAELYRKHLNLSKRKALDEAAKNLERVGLPPSEIPLNRYPFELSGGQRQRVVIALALALKPKLLIADEPTSALDVHTEAQILMLLKSLCVEDDVAVLFISHDLTAIAQLSDGIAVMKEGEIVEQGSSPEFFASMSHPYSIELYKASQYFSSNYQSTDVIHTEPIQQESISPILEVKNLSCAYDLGRPHFFSKLEKFRALENISFHLMRGESLGLVGESGSGKSTLVRAILGLESIQTGTVVIDGQPFFDVPRALQKALRRQIQVVFQDPYGSFNPRHKVHSIVGEPLHLLDSDSKLSAPQRNERIAQTLADVGLSASDADKYPHEFSGGQRQRIAIARALVVRPSIVVLDEATSALDVSVRAQVLELLSNLSVQRGLAYLFVSHDLEVVRAVTTRVLILQAGKIIEEGLTNDVFASPEHPYTQSLVNSKLSLQAQIKKKSEIEQALLE